MQTGSDAFGNTPGNAFSYDGKTRDWTQPCLSFRLTLAIQIKNENYASEYAAGNYSEGNSFDFKDDNDFYVWVLFRENNEEFADEYEDKLYEMPEVSDFRTEPEYNYPEDDTGPGLLGWRWFDYNGIVFCYDDGILRSVRWTYREYEVLVSALVQDDELEVYPSYGKNTYYSRLINPKTTQQAVQELNNTMLWAFYIRPVLVRVVLPVISIVAAAGTVYLIVRRKRRKAVDKAAMSEGEITKE